MRANSLIVRGWFRPEMLTDPVKFAPYPPSMDAAI